MNLANAYNHKHEYDEEMIAINKVLEFTDNAAPILFLKGKLLEKTNNIDSANKLYYLAKIGFEKRLIKRPDNINDINELILLTAITEGKELAIKELNKQISLHPKLSDQLSEKISYYKTFDRHIYMSEYNN